jgi:hypothetical protein
MARAFKCKECGTGYSTTGNGAPPSPRWDDGHVCEMVEVESKISPLKSRQGGKIFPPIGLRTQEEEDDADERMKIIAQNGNDGLHY